MDYWYVYLAMPVAPLILVAQLLAMPNMRRGPLLALNAAAVVAIAAMCALVWAYAPESDPTPNLGGYMLTVWLAGSLWLLYKACGRSSD